MMIFMKFIFVLFPILSLLGCYSTQNPEFFLDFGTKSYFLRHSGNEFYTKDKRNKLDPMFTTVTMGRFANISTNEQKAYAYMYLAKIELKYSNLKEATSFLDESEKYSNSFPYEYDLLLKYFYFKRDFTQSKKYAKLLLDWIDKRISEVKNGSFDVNKLEFMNIRSYFNGKFESEYIDMYNKEKSKKFREDIYKKYLENKKIYAQKVLNEL